MYFLTLAALLAIDQYAPQIMAQPVATLAECKEAAAAANKDDERLQAPEFKAAGVQYVCLYLAK